VDRVRWREASNGGLYHWRLASFPIHYPWIVDAQTAMFREQLANHLEKFSRENMGALVRRPWVLRGIDHYKGALGTEDFLSLGAELTAPTARRRPQRLAPAEEDLTPLPLSMNGERGRIVLAFGEPCAGVHGFWRRREMSLGPRRS